MTLKNPSWSALSSSGLSYPSLRGGILNDSGCPGQIGTAQSIQDGALLNYNALGRQNGSLYGCQLILASSTLITITKGMIVLRGYRVEIEDHEIFNTVGLPLPTNQETRYVVLRIDVESGNASAEIQVRGNNAQHGNEIERLNGFA